MRIAEFAKDRRGGVAVILGIALIPIVGLTGATIDYARGLQLRTQLQAAADAAVLAGASLAKRDDGERIAHATKVLPPTSPRRMAACRRSTNSA